MESSSSSGGVNKSVDYARYYDGYGYLYHQKKMLSDRVRMDAYYNAIFKNQHHFLGKTVLDVGTGSGILAIWSAQAGARKVYAVEASKMAKHARTLIQANNLGDVIQVIEGCMEEVDLPEKVDVIISEWMGSFLLTESLLDSVICARDRWLKPTGVMYPSRARLWVAPFNSELQAKKMYHHAAAMTDWYRFVVDTTDSYGVDMSALNEPFDEEQSKYYLQTSVRSNLRPHQVIGTEAVVKEIQCSTVTVNDITNIRSRFVLSVIPARAKLCGFGGWFDVSFAGSGEDPAREVVELTTAPSRDLTTHWGQRVFLVFPCIPVEKGDVLSVSLSLGRSEENHRSLEAEFECEISKKSGELPPSPFKIKYSV